MIKTERNSRDGAPLTRFLCESRGQQTFDVVLKQDILQSTLEYAFPQQMIIFRVKQDAQGGHPFTYPENVKGADLVSLEPGALTQQMFMFDGENAWPLAPAWTSAKPPANHMEKVEASDTATPAARREKRKWL